MLLPQLHATRAISGHSVPIITTIAAGAGSIIHSLGPESIGGLGDYIAKIDAEAARTGVPSEISDRVHTSAYILNELTDLVSKDN